MYTPESLPSELDLSADGPTVWDREFVESIDGAQDRVERERNEVAVEIEALTDFERRVRALSDAQAAPANPPGMQAFAGQGGATRLSVLRDAYRETVMSTGHYEREYDEPFQSNLAAELGPDVARTIVNGGDAPLTPQFKGAVIAAAEEARRDREVFLDQLDAERESLAETRRTLADVARALGSLAEGTPRTGRRPGLSTRIDAIERIEEVISTRQQFLHSRSQANRTTGHSLCAYLYGDQPTYPVLKSAAMLIEAIERMGA